MARFHATQRATGFARHRLRSVRGRAPSECEKAQARPSRARGQASAASDFAGNGAPGLELPLPLLLFLHTAATLQRCQPEGPARSPWVSARCCNRPRERPPQAAARDSTVEGSGYSSGTYEVYRVSAPMLCAPARGAGRGLASPLSSVPRKHWIRTRLAPTPR
jgi:hypothetical protein